MFLLHAVNYALNDGKVVLPNIVGTAHSCEGMNLLKG